MDYRHARDRRRSENYPPIDPIEDGMSDEFLTLLLSTVIILQHAGIKNRAILAALAPSNFGL